MSEPLWQPSKDRIADTNMTRFIAAVAARLGRPVADSDELHVVSLDQPEVFWPALIDFTGAKAETWGDTVLADADRMPGAKWFPEARLSFAENLLRHADVTPGADAIVFQGEGGNAQRRLSFVELRDAVSRLSQALSMAGVGPGDRVAGYMPNMPETIIAMLAANAIGAVWSSCSPDFGAQGVLDRFGQIEPKVIFAADGYRYDGKRHDCLAKVAEITRGLASVTNVVIAPYGDAAVSAETVAAAVPGAVTLDAFMAPFQPGTIDFARLAFDHPLYILYSSGTTGAPKCIVHGQGGALLKHATEQVLHCDVRSGDRVFFFTTCGWMMWNWLVGNLAWGATVLLFDGSPFHPGPNALFDFASAGRATLFGTSAKFIDAIAKEGLDPATTHDLSTVRTLCSTGSPLLPEGYDYVYAHIKADVHLASISGGTDIMGCFLAGDPTKAVMRGEMQAPVLGMAVEVYDDAGRPVRGNKGELVCAKPFPSMPVKFWGDDDAQSRYRAAYFAGFPGVWTHGDYMAVTEHGGYVIYGRSDATLNPGGVRIGTAEIYRQVETLAQVAESIVIGQEWDNDTRVVLFVVLRDGAALDDALVKEIKTRIRVNCSPRHVPGIILQVADIPRTKSGKITELAVRDVVHGRPIKNVEALANPEALEHFRDLPELSR